MADLSVEFAGVRFENPILIGSSSLTNNIEKLERLEQAGAGGIVTKVISDIPLTPGHTSPLRSFVLNDSWCIVGDVRLGLDEGIALIEEAKKKLKIPIIANIISGGGDETRWVEFGLALQKAGADMLEIDLNWPLPPPDEADREYDSFDLGLNPSLTGKVVKVLKKGTDIPIIAKITPKIDLIGVAKACIENGVDAITIGNVRLGLPGVDIRNGGKPIYPFVEKGGISPYMGAYLHPIANLRTAILAKKFNKPLSSGGGIMTWEHMLERIMLGAHTVQLCSAIYLHGLEVIDKCLRKLDAYLYEYGYSKLEDIRGCALPYVVPFGETVIHPCVARIVDEKKCLDCEDLCFYEVNGDCLAMSLTERGIPHINEEKCTGCALCYWHCAKSAIVMEPK